MVNCCVTLLLYFYIFIIYMVYFFMTTKLKDVKMEEQQPGNLFPDREFHILQICRRSLKYKYCHTFCILDRLNENVMTDGF